MPSYTWKNKFYYDAFLNRFFFQESDLPMGTKPNLKTFFFGNRKHFFKFCFIRFLKIPMYIFCLNLNYLFTQISDIKYEWIQKLKKNSQNLIGPIHVQVHIDIYPKVSITCYNKVLISKTYRLALFNIMLNIRKASKHCLTWC